MNYKINTECVIIGKIDFDYLYKSSFIKNANLFYDKLMTRCDISFSIPKNTQFFDFVIDIGNSLFLLEDILYTNLCMMTTDIYKDFRKKNGLNITYENNKIIIPLFNVVDKQQTHAYEITLYIRNEAIEKFSYFYQNKFWENNCYLIPRVRNCEFIMKRLRYYCEYDRDHQDILKIYIFMRDNTKDFFELYKGMIDRYKNIIFTSKNRILTTIIKIKGHITSEFLIELPSIHTDYSLNIYVFFKRKN